MNEGLLRLMAQCFLRERWLYSDGDPRLSWIREEDVVWEFDDLEREDGGGGVLCGLGVVRFVLVWGG